MFRLLWDQLAGLRFAWRAPLKTVLFYTVVLFTFYPNPLLLVRQVRYWVAPETLIRADFPALPAINRELDSFLPAAAPPEMEYRLVQNYVALKVRGMSDLENWGVLDYSPDAEAVWARQRGDCEDQAVLAVSILRSRGHRDARMVGNLVHMWVEVDQQEILNPLPDRTYEQNESLTPAVPAGPTVLLAAAAMVGGFPAIRGVIILLALLVLCYHPHRNLPGFLGCLVVTLLGYAMVRDWAAAYSVDQALGLTWALWIGSLLLLGGVLGAGVAGRIRVRREGSAG